MVEKRDNLNNEKNNISRRGFLVGAGGFALGAVTTGMGLNLLKFDKKQEVSVSQRPEVPVEYKRLDSEELRRRGYEEYSNGGCMYGAVAALVKATEEKTGQSTALPLGMFRYGGGGVAGSGSLCGSLNGAAAFINLVSEDHNRIINELLDWYKEYQFPNQKHDAYADFTGQVQTVAHSNLCSDSVMKWVEESGYYFGSPEQRNRCAKLTGDVAAKTVELLNKNL
ncbi:C-GCAxxG-C-C family protein [Halonatronum saccharophilum]|uniref:C-GCAxxG-C-C family protein n=1 Tax=Halonatronum saccharophilum TaxID=150060 RepID=UPI0004B4E186|nr:C-GCAxxG-C-C family protein [Halonatronum saccharophilum]